MNGLRGLGGRAEITPSSPAAPFPGAGMGGIGLDSVKNNEEEEVFKEEEVINVL